MTGKSERERVSSRWGFLFSFLWRSHKYGCYYQDIYTQHLFFLREEEFIANRGRERAKRLGERWTSEGENRKLAICSTRRVVKSREKGRKRERKSRHNQTSLFLLAYSFFFSRCCVCEIIIARIKRDSFHSLPGPQWMPSPDVAWCLSHFTTICLIGSNWTVYQVSGNKFTTTTRTLWTFSQKSAASGSQIDSHSPLRVCLFAALVHTISLSLITWFLSLLSLPSEKLFSLHRESLSLFSCVSLSPLSETRTQTLTNTPKRERGKGRDDCRTPSLNSPAPFPFTLLTLSCLFLFSSHSSSLSPSLHTSLHYIGVLSPFISLFAGERKKRPTILSKREE